MTANAAITVRAVTFRPRWRLRHDTGFARIAVTRRSTATSSVFNRDRKDPIVDGAQEQLALYRWLRLNDPSFEIGGSKIGRSDSKQGGTIR
jgi:hypothetical protein